MLSQTIGKSGFLQVMHFEEECPKPHCSFYFVRISSSVPPTHAAGLRCKQDFGIIFSSGKHVMHVGEGIVKIRLVSISLSLLSILERG